MLLGWEFLSSKVSSSLTIRTKQYYKEMKLKIYFEEAYNELVHKVSWPTWKELQSSALIVMVASFIIALIVFVMDFSFENIMSFVYSLFY
jgi:preprotein translocase subunit SecE